MSLNIIISSVANDDYLYIQVFGGRFMYGMVRNRENVENLYSEFI